MLEHGFVCTGIAEPGPAAGPALGPCTGGSVTLQLLPAGWNANADTFTFGYVHPLRLESERFTLKVLALGGALVVHAASCNASGELLTTNLTVDATVEDSDPASVSKRAKDWQEKTAQQIAQKLLSRENSTARLGKALEAQEAPEKVSGTKRPAPEDERGGERRRDEREDPRRRPDYETERDRPFFPMRPYGDDRPVIWTPHGGLLGPRHPAWGQVVPPGRGGRLGGDGGMLPRFDPIGPHGGEPDPDHLRVPGFPDGIDFPAFQGGASGRGRLDPDGRFIM